MGGSVTEYAWIDRDGTERLRGTIDPAPGGAQTVNVTKYSFPFSFEVGGVPIQDDWLTFATLPANTLLLAYQAFVTEAWNAGGRLTVNDQAAGAGNNVFHTGQNLQTYGSDGIQAIGNTVTTTAFHYTAGTSLSVTTDAAAISGNLDLYLLTYAP